MSRVALTFNHQKPIIHNREVDTNNPSKRKLSDITSSFVNRQSTAIKDVLRKLPVRRVWIEKTHSDVPGLLAKLCWRRGLRADDVGLFHDLSDDMQRDHSVDVQEHFARASSSTNTLRLLKDLAELQDSTDILEIGSGYGLSAIALARTEQEPRVVTVENSETRFEIARSNAEKAEAANVECLHSDKAEAIQSLLDRRERFDFIFHDGGHYGDDYVRDFHMLRRMAKPGSLMVFDDIAWDRTSKVRSMTRRKSVRSCLEGWKEVVASPFVKWAFAVSGKMGVLRMA